MTMNKATADTPQAYSTYIFDLDGTLLDTLRDLAASVNYALRQFGMPEHSLDDIRRFVGNGVRRLMERAVPDGADHPQFEDVFAIFRRYYMEHSLDTTRPYDGITDTLRELKRRGCRMAVVSNKMMAATQELVRHFFPEIDVAIGEHEAEGIRRKPAPDTVYEALRPVPARKWCHNSRCSTTGLTILIGYYRINSSSRYLGSVHRPSSTIISSLSVSLRMLSMWGQTVSW